MTYLLLASLHACGESGEGRSCPDVLRGGPDTMSVAWKHANKKSLDNYY